MLLARGIFFYAAEADTVGRPIYKGSILVSAILRSGLLIPRVEIPLTKQGTPYAIIETANDGDVLRIEVIFDQASDLLAADEEAVKIARELIASLTYDRGVIVEDPTVEERRLKRVSASSDVGKVLLCEPGRYKFKGGTRRATLKMTASTARAVIRELPPRKDEFILLYVSAYRAARPVERFLSLYHLLMLVVGKKQNEADKFIKRAAPGTKTSQWRKREETVFTRLRNEFSHPEDRKVSLDQIKKEMAGNTDELARLVKLAISQRP